MTEDVTRYGSGVPGDEPPRSDAGAPGAGDSADDLAALERLKALGGGSAHAKHQPAPAEQLPEARARGAHAAPRRRPSASYGSGRTVARLAVPVVFLVAVIVVVVLALQSGVLGGDGAETAVSPSPSVSASAAGSTKAPSATKVYVVKSGDTLSGIAAKFKTTVGDLEDLNPKVNTTTLVVGTKIKVPSN
jgi:LysM repeat protein